MLSLLIPVKANFIQSSESLATSMKFEKVGSIVSGGAQRL